MKNTYTTKELGKKAKEINENAEMNKMLIKGFVFTGIWFTGRIEVIEVLHETNILVVELKKYSSTWREDWNLEHVKVGFKRRDYFIGKYKKETVYTRPVVEHKYTQEDWIYSTKDKAITISKKDEDNIISKEICVVTKYRKEEKEVKSNGLLIAQSPKMHQMCEAFFDMLNSSHKDSIYLPIVAKILNDINPKQ